MLEGLNVLKHKASLNYSHLSPSLPLSTFPHFTPLLLCLSASLPLYFSNPVSLSRPLLSFNDFLIHDCIPPWTNKDNPNFSTER